MAVGFAFNFSVSVSGDEASGSKLRSVEEEENVACKRLCLNSVCPDSVPNGVPVSKQIPVLPCHRARARACAYHSPPSVVSIPGTGTKLWYISGQQRYDTDHSSAENADSAPAGTELESLLTLSDSRHSDLIPGVYEGGLKLWECAIDLVHFLSKSNIDFSGMRILELGCGTGLPGIYSAIRGAKDVHFQDYNPEVLNFVTIPNVILNTEFKNENETEGMVDTGFRTCGVDARSKNENQTGSMVETGSKTSVDAGSKNENETRGTVDFGSKTQNSGSTSENGNVTEAKFKFYSGDWSGLASVLEPGESYDFILTSETIYSLDSQPKLLSVLKQACKKGTGVVYVAAKTFYFGVGGGVANFCQLVEEDGTFSVCQCRKIHASVPRVVLKLTRTTQLQTP